ncbi:MAG TPA: dihydropteroate synthase [Anaerolineales bacterium]|nr:dihydropteroate synthase [Anaerolineales bacterium]
MNPLRVANHIFDWGSRTYVMGILNVTPDSFSGDGLLSLIEAEDPMQPMLDQARRFLAAGCDILDVGGESTRPGSRPVDAFAEKKRVVPAIRSLARTFPDTLISVDTYKAEVAEAAINAGAHIINDVWALRGDPDLAPLAAKQNMPVVLMHNRSDPASVEVKERLGNAYTGSEYENLIEDVKRELMDSVDIARRAGIPDERIILDPGIGFGKTVDHNLELIRRLEEIRALGFPVLLGPSRKSFIGYTLDLPPSQRVEGTAAAVAVGIARGADIVRVHDVETISRTVKMTDAIVRTSNS